MTPAELDKIDPGSIGQVFNLCQQKGQTCTGLNEHLKNPDLFSQWTGSTGEAAQRAAKEHRVDIDAHGNEAVQVGFAAWTAERQFQEAKDKLRDARSYIAERPYLSLDDSTGKVTATFLSRPEVAPGVPLVGPYASQASDAEENRLRELNRQWAEKMVKEATDKGNEADMNLATAIEGASGQRPISGIETQSMPTPEKPDHVPGVVPPSTINGKPTMGQANLPGNANRILPNVRVPLNATPEELQRLGAMYAPAVALDPNKKGSTGGYSGNLLTGRNADGKATLTVPGPRDPNPTGNAANPGKLKNIDISVSKGVQFRTTGATPSQYYVALDGKGNPCLGVNYKYNYEMRTQYAVNVGSIPIIPTATWHPVSSDSAVGLTQQYPDKVKLPTP
ncbi:hypothetical protein [Mycobacteroides sp. LB1]|uniref:hypothetical protein n=1 Tax=Mycobacteroides sp. LB1 TaxID=2750814 RepID=UPI0015DD5E90|nr:hypothetical protein [Mycobacteroides sp. LB1]